MARTQESSSVFTDDSGVRTRVVQGAVRGVLALLALGVAAVVVSLMVGVPLPGLAGPAHQPGSEKSSGSKAGTSGPGARREPASSPGRTADAGGGSGSGTSAVGDAVGAGSGATTIVGSPAAPPAATPAGLPVDIGPAPTSDPGAGPTSNPTSDPGSNPTAVNGKSDLAPRAEPTKTGGGGPPASPPGKSKQ